MERTMIERHPLCVCRSCGKKAHVSEFEAPSNCFLARVPWTRIECRGHPYISVCVEAEGYGEAAAVWNKIMQENTK